MIAPAAAAYAVVVLLSAPGPSGSSRPADDADKAARSNVFQLETPRPVLLTDAPTTSTQAFTASALTSLTGIGVLAALAEGPPRRLPMGDVSFHARIATGLLLLSVGPSVGDLINHDPAGFTGAIGRTVLVALGWGAFSLAASTTDGTVIGTSVLFMTLGGLVWLGWASTDLVRSLFAPERWVDRQNRQRLGVRVVNSTAPGRRPLAEF
ncbi:MAG TPA: hypothetical protein VE549_06310 [Myxococcaceae bacterium]|jgi:hypothetical protein|nr:hypothetical protein [Myxococcaceae bacterium]